MNSEYKIWLEVLKQRIRQAQLKAAVKVNRELIGLYWLLGNDIAEKEQKKVWGDGFLVHLAADLAAEFPDIKGFSPTNLKYIRKWHLFYNQPNTIGQQLVDQLGQANLTLTTSSNSQQPVDQILLDLLSLVPWGHHIQIITKCKTLEEALFYLVKTAQNNWSRNILVNQIEGKLYDRQGKAIHNFNLTLPASQSELARETLKNPYNFDFLSLGEEALERDLENALIEHITKFLLELGAGFAYVGRQHHLEVNGEDFYLDLLFYHTRLHCYVVIELKIGEFKPEYAGKLNFYLSVVDDKIRDTEDKPTIGILLCKNSNKVVAEYALKDISKPIGVSEYQLTSAIPEEMKGELPTIEELESTLEEELNEPKTYFDKKLHSLKEKIAEKKEEEIKLEKTSETLRDLFEKSLRPFLHDLKTEVGKLHEYFLYTHIQWNVNGMSQYNNIDAIEEYFIHSKGLEETRALVISISLSKFKRSNTNAFDVHLSIYFDFDFVWYQARFEYNTSQFSFRKLYHHQLARDEREEMIKQITDGIFSQIDRHLST